MVSAPVVLVLCLTIWRMPYPVGEAVGIFEDVERNEPTRFLKPEVSYYRPLFYMTVSGIWRNGSDLEPRLATIKLLHIVPICLLVLVFVWHLRPRTAVDAAAALTAVAVLIGSPGFRDNLEIPLSYTIVGMPVVLIVWLLLTRERRSIWSGVAIVVLSLIAIGFKEQGLVIVPLVVAAWWTRASGTSPLVAGALVAIALTYVACRLIARGGEWPVFEQAIGLGFDEIEPREAAARFGAFPYFVYAYSAAATVANVLFSEPTRGVFSIFRSVSRGQAASWQLIHLGSSAALTVLIAGWGIAEVRRTARRGLSPEARVFIAMLIVLLASGALSFSYSRDRLGGMAVPFYALAAFFALRMIAREALEASRWHCVLSAVALTFVAVTWQIRAIGTIEQTRLTSLRSQSEWLTDLPQRRLEFADRPVYLNILESLIDQGTARGAPRPTRYPPWVAVMLGLPPSTDRWP
jgi:hypothetical protein